MRNYRTTVILLVVLAAAIAGFMLVNGKASSEDSNAVFKLEDNSIIEISIKSEAGSVKFSKTDGKWEMLEPKRYIINQESVNRLESKLENFEALRVIEKNADDLSKYGLDKPVTTLKFKTRDGMENVLYIGMKTASNYQVYARKSTAKSVYTVTLTDLEALGDGKPSAFRERNFLSVDKKNINTLCLDINGKRELKITENEPGKWQFNEPCRVDAKNDSISEILKGINGLTIKDFIQDDSADLGKYNLKNPLYTLVLGDKSGKKQTIYFGKSDENNKEVFIRLDNDKSVYTVSTEAFSPESLKISDLLNETPLSIGIGKVSKVIINDRGVTSVFDRDTSKTEDVFTLNGKAVDNDSFVALYVDMMALTADGYDAANKGTSPSLTVTYQLMENGGSVKMELSKRNDSSYFITVDGDPLPFYVSGQKVELVRRWIKRVIKA